MIIGLDVSMLVYQGSGVATYTYNLVKALLRYDSKNEYRLFYSSLRKPPHFYYLDEFKNLGGKIYHYPFPPRFLKLCWNRHHLMPVEWLIGEVDVYHSSDFLRPPLSKKTKGMTTIHDLTWKIFPRFHTNDIVTAHEKKIAKTIKYHDDIIVDSDNTKKDLLKNYSTIETTNRIFVIYPGVDDHFKPEKDTQKIKTVLKKYNVAYPKKYLLYVGALEPRKNIDRFLMVFSQFIREKSYADFEFLLVGRTGWKNETTFTLIKQLGLAQKVGFVGYVEDDDLPFFYNASKVFIYLSLYEGFGLPPLEALKCGVPVLAYKNSSLREIFPNNYPFTQAGQEWATLKQLLRKPVLVDDKYLQRFDWRKTAVNFVRLYKRGSF